MTGKHPYEAYGIRPDGGSFTVEILGHQAEADAIALARHYAELWRSAVDLYRVPFINTASAPLGSGRTAIRLPRPTKTRRR